MDSGLPPFQRFLEDHRDAVWRFLAASVGPHEADDCFQETLIAALRAYPRLRPNSNLRGWVLTIAHRKAMDSHRARTRRALPVGGPEQLEGRGGGGLDPAAAGRRDTELWEAVHDLPARQRSAVVLRYAGDLPHRDIAV